MLEALGFGKLAYHLINEYVSFHDHLMSNHGRSRTIKILKDLHSRTNLAVLGNYPRGPLGDKWFKLNSYGLPKRLKFLRQAVIEYPIAATSVTAFVRLYKDKPSTNIETITSPNTSKWPPSWLTSFETYISKKVRPIEISTKPWHTSTKSGPCGPAAVVSSSIDAIALAMTPGTLALFEQGCHNSNSGYLLERYNQFMKEALQKDLSGLRWPGQLTIAKLAYLSDKAGKTRVVYILNYWWQELLKPLHDAVFHWLRHQPQDGTFDQRKAAETVKLWTKEGKPLWSYDLTAATDRWPKDHQYIVMKYLAGPVWSTIWYDGMGIAPYSYPHQKWVFYGVGQPMGAYASWAALAATHHWLIRYACDLTGADWNSYVVLGDDVVIADEAVAKTYRMFLDDLGVTISDSKSVVPNGTSDSMAEFAKRLFRNGEELTPIPPTLIKQVWNDYQWWSVLDLLYEMRERFGMEILVSPCGHLWFPTPLKPLLDAVPNAFKKKLWVLIGDPEGPKRLHTKVESVLNPEDYSKIPNPWAGINELVYLSLRRDMLYDQLGKKAEALIKLQLELSKGNSGNKLSGWLLELPSHVIWAILDRLNNEIRHVCMTIAMGESPLREAQDLAMDADFLEKLLLKGRSYREWKDAKSRRLKMACNFSLQLHQQVINPSKAVVDHYDNEDW